MTQTQEVEGENVKAARLTEWGNYDEVFVGKVIKTTSTLRGKPFTVYTFVVTDKLESEVEIGNEYSIKQLRFF